MAQPINCDGAGEGHPADVLVSRLDNGETTAWCDLHYIEVCRAIVDAVEAAERDATDAAALAQLAAAEAGEPVTLPADVVPLDAGGVGAAPGGAFPTSGDSSDAAAPPAEPPTKPAGEPLQPEPPVGATRSRRARPEPSTGG